MKKKWLCIVLVLAFLAGGFLLRDQILDLLPIDQSKWIPADAGRIHLGEKGDPDLGWFTDESGVYYLDPDAGGVTVTGWVDIEGGHYRFADDGIMVTGWVEDNGGRWYLDTDGRALTGWNTIGGEDYLLDAEGRMVTGWAERDGKRCFLDENGHMATGLQEADGIRCFLGGDGFPAAGWQQDEDNWYYVNEDGSLYTGWLEMGDQRYYLTEDGAAARGRREVDGQTLYFTSHGAEILLVNRWNPVPDDYTVDLAITGYGSMVDSKCVDAMIEMLDACRAAGNCPVIISGYRSYWDQISIFNANLKVYNGNYASTQMVAAIPGTSEHQLGLAADIIDDLNRNLSAVQVTTRTQQWLMEHCWEYGFILRYPDGSTDYTGIIFEPWHYRYVGKELSLELRDLGICLEQYLDELTGDGTSCGGIDKT